MQLDSTRDTVGFEDMNMPRVLISVLLTIALAACQSKPVDPEQVRGSLLEADERLTAAVVRVATAT